MSDIPTSRIPYGVGAVELDTGEGCRTRLSHDGAHIFVRQWLEDGEGGQKRHPDEIELDCGDARKLASLLIGMANMLDRGGEQ